MNNSAGKTYISTSYVSTTNTKLLSIREILRRLLISVFLNHNLEVNTLIKSEMT